MHNERCDKCNDDRDNDALDDVSAHLFRGISRVMSAGLRQDDGRGMLRGVAIVKGKPVRHKRITGTPDVVPRQMEIKLEGVKRAAMICGFIKDPQNIFGITRQHSKHNLSGRYTPIIANAFQNRKEVRTHDETD